MFTKDWFSNLDKALRDAGLDSDSSSFDEIKDNLQHRKILSRDEFARAVAYVILAGGFSQKTAKRKHAEIMQYLETASAPNVDDMLKIFNNKNKMSAILKIWQNQAAYTDGYYALSDLDAKLKYLSSLPHIGKITANHLARNLGENVVKYDIWIQRLGALYAGNSGIEACNAMFAHMEKETGLPRGYIDVVLWKACQNGYIKL
jgi:hypothetical protein